MLTREREGSNLTTPKVSARNDGRTCAIVSRATSGSHSSWRFHVRRDVRFVLEEKTTRMVEVWGPPSPLPLLGKGSGGRAVSLFNFIIWG